MDSAHFLYLGASVFGVVLIDANTINLQNSLMVLVANMPKVITWKRISNLDIYLCLVVFVLSYPILIGLVASGFPRELNSNLPAKFHMNSNLASIVPK